MFITVAYCGTLYVYWQKKEKKKKKKKLNLRMLYKKYLYQRKNNILFFTSNK